MNKTLKIISFLGVCFFIGGGTYTFFNINWSKGANLGKDDANNPTQNTQKSYDIYEAAPKGFDPTTDYDYLHPKEGISRHTIKKSNKLVGSQGGKRSKKIKRKGKGKSKRKIKGKNKNKYSTLKKV